MSASAIKQQLAEVIDTLPENELEVVLDFATYLKDRGQAEDFLKMQMNSNAYQDWVGQENDIYDEVFGDELEKG
ncbi:MAG: hypothetical protein HYU86_07515 [Chloroflexi bacterium]|nr:hypothetical protein [Chloroflexota bacterium]